MEEKTTKEKAFSPEARAEAVARFAEAMNRDDIDGFVFGVSLKEGGMIAAATGNKGVITNILACIFAESELAHKIFMKGVAIHTLRIIAEGGGND